MNVIEIASPGGPENLKLNTREIPTLQKQEVLIKVSGSGINRPDLMQRQGLYPPPPGASDLPGLEVSGKIVELGSQVMNWKKGENVCALANGGGYAEYTAVPAEQCLPIPDGVSVTDASSFPETFFTVWVNIFDRGKLKPGETLLVHGGASGIGTAAIQMANSLGHDVFVTAGTETKCNFCEALGAKAAINYSNEDYLKRIRELTDNKGVNVILDMVGGQYLQKNLDCLADDGRLSIIAFLGGTKTEVNLSDILRRRLTVTGSTLRPRSTEKKATIARELKKNIWPLISSGKIQPQIFKKFSFKDAAKAHTLMEKGDHMGKIILEWEKN